MALKKTVQINTLEAVDAYIKITTRGFSDRKVKEADKVQKKFTANVQVGIFTDNSCDIDLGIGDDMEMQYNFVTLVDEPTLEGLYVKLKKHKDFKDATDC